LRGARNCSAGWPGESVWWLLGVVELTMLDAAEVAESRDGIIFTDEDQKYFNQPTESPKAALVLSVTCQSASLAAVAQGADNFIGVNGNPSTYAQHNAVIAAVDIIVRAGTVNSGVLENVKDVVQSTLRNNFRQGNPDRNATVVLNPSVLPPSLTELKITTRRPQD
jgi:glutamate 5-kinase